MALPPAVKVYFAEQVDFVELTLVHLIQVLPDEAALSAVSMLGPWYSCAAARQTPELSVTVNLSVTVFLPVAPTTTGLPPLTTTFEILVLPTESSACAAGATRAVRARAPVMTPRVARMCNVFPTWKGPRGTSLSHEIRLLVGEP